MERNKDGPITEEYMKKRFKKHYDTFLKKVNSVLSVTLAYCMYIPVTALCNL